MFGGKSSHLKIINDSLKNNLTQVSYETSHFTNHPNQTAVKPNELNIRDPSPNEEEIDDDLDVEEEEDYDIDEDDEHNAKIEESLNGTHQSKENHQFRGSGTGGLVIAQSEIGKFRPGKAVFKRS